MSKYILFASLLASSVSYGIDFGDVKPTFDHYCIRCHGNAAHAGGIDFQNYPFTSALNPNAKPADIVKRALIRMRATTFAMPPGGGVPKAQVDAIETWLNAGLPEL